MHEPDAFGAVRGATGPRRAGTGSFPSHAVVRLVGGRREGAGDVKRVGGYPHGGCGARGRSAATGGLAVHGVEEALGGEDLGLGGVAGGERGVQVVGCGGVEEVVREGAEEEVERELGEAALVAGAEDGVALGVLSACLSLVYLVSAIAPHMLTFPEPVTPSVASRPSRPSPPPAASTPSTSGMTPVPWKMSSCDAASSKTSVNANFSTARRRLSFGGFSVMCVGAPSVGSSTVRKRSGVVRVG